MPRPVFWRVAGRRGLLLFGAAAVLAGGTLSGCGSMMTTRAIEQFQTHLEAGDLSRLSAATTDRFRTAALPDPSALPTFDLLDVPVGELTIVEVREPSETTRDVDVTVEGSSQKLTYHLVKNADSLGPAKWLVDEITMRQGGSRRAVEKTVSDQMSLLLGVRDSVRMWQEGDADAVANNAVGELSDSLGDVPPAWRSQLAARFFGGVLKSKPRAKLINGQAQVELAHKEGRLKLVLDEGDAGWQVRTAVLVGRDKSIVSEARTEAATLAAVAEFTAALEQGNLSTLQTCAAEDLYENALAVSDLSGVTLRWMEIASAPYELRSAGDTAELSLPLGEATVQFSVGPRDGSTRQRSVSEVTTYDAGQTRRLSAELLTLPTVELFARTFESGDVQRLRHLTTRQWERPVWSAYGPGREDAMLSLPLPPFPRQPADSTAAASVRYDGPTVEVRQVTDDAIVTYRLNAAAGRVLVDDVELIDLRGAISLRDRLAVLLTMDQAADAILTGDLETLADASSPTLNRLVWNWSTPEDLPPSLDLLPLLKAPVRTVTVGSEAAVVTVGDDRSRAKLLFSGVRPRLDEVVFLDAVGIEVARLSGAARQHRAAGH